jgi:hypothetical protein
MQDALPEGVMFVTYSALIAKRKGDTRMKQLTDWCGENFDGALCFDECHKAKNLNPKAKSDKGSSQTALAVVEIQVFPGLVSVQ